MNRIRHNLKDQGCGVPQFQSTRGLPDTQWSLPQTQGSIYMTNKRGNLPNCYWWTGCQAIGEREGESVVGGPEVRATVLVGLRP